MTTEKEHDPLCPKPVFGRCSCVLIAQVRADEKKSLLAFAFRCTHCGGPGHQCEEMPL